MGRVILHSDINNCYASIECLTRPDLTGKPVAVGGSEASRHGIILAKNQLAKKYGIKTAENIWKARQKCPDLIVLPPNYQLYLKYSRMARNIYSKYSKRIEPFGLDEAWIDVTEAAEKYGSGERIAEEIRGRFKNELGITVSVGVADNKVFAKLASDLKKPDAVTVIDKDNFRERIWPLAVENLLYVGRATTAKLRTYGIKTIGDLAMADIKFLKSLLGKHGETIHTFANGMDSSPVQLCGYERVIKSIGNSTTTPRDIKDPGDARTIFNMLCEKVASRLREEELVCEEIQIYMRSTDLYSFERQAPLPRPTAISSELCAAAVALMEKNYDWDKPLRSIGVRACRLLPEKTNFQLSFFIDEGRRMKLEDLENIKDKIRLRYGDDCIRRAITLTDQSLTGAYFRHAQGIQPFNNFTWD